jgi:hypothetical protein
MKCLKDKIKELKRKHSEKEKKYEEQINRLTKIIYARKSKSQSNLTPIQKGILETLHHSSTTFKIVPTDKNLGPAVMNRPQYMQHCLKDHLLNKSNYRQLSEMPATDLRELQKMQITNFLRSDKTTEQSKVRRFKNLRDEAIRLASATIPQTHLGEYQLRTNDIL